MFTLFLFSVPLAMLCIGAWLVETDRLVWSVLLTAAAVACGIYLYEGRLSLNTGLIVALAIGYFVTGVAWSLYRWYLYLKMFKLNLRNIDEAYAQGYPDIPKGHSNYRNTYHNWFVQKVLDSDLIHASYRSNLIKRKPIKIDGDMKKRIVAWLTLWPYSVVGTLFRYPARYVVERLASTYQRIANHVFKDTEFS